MRSSPDFVSGEGDGLLNLFVPHATAGIAVIETGAGSDDDLLYGGNQADQTNHCKSRHRESVGPLRCSGNAGNKDGAGDSGPKA